MAAHDVVSEATFTWARVAIEVKFGHPKGKCNTKSLTIEKYRVKIKTGPTGNKALELFF